MDSSVTFSEKLKRWRGNKQPKEAADILGIPLSTYHAYERGTRIPHHSTCACCLEMKMLLSCSTVLPSPLPPLNHAFMHGVSH